MPEKIMGLIVGIAIIIMSFTLEVSFAKFLIFVAGMFMSLYFAALLRMGD